MRYRRLGLLLGLALVSAAIVGVALAAAGDNPQPISFTHNVVNAPAPVAGVTWANGPKVKTGTAICTTETSTAANVNTDCEENGPHNETSIAVNPTDSNNIIGGANDYQLSFNPGGHVGETVLSRAHVTFDGGKTWSEYPVYSRSTYQATGDPSVAFDADGRAYYATLGFRFVGLFNAQSPDVLVATSGDKGKTWDVHRVASGSGTAFSVADSLDKEYVAAWGHGNAIVTFGDFVQAQMGNIVGADIYDSVTHNGGKTWSKPTKITDTGEAFGSVPAVTKSGKIFVSYLNTPADRLIDKSAADYGRDDYMLQQVDPDTGAAIGTPIGLGTVYDGYFDYPWDTTYYDQTYQDSLFRTWAFGNVATDPTDSNDLAVVWSDMRNTSDRPFGSFDPTTGEFDFLDPYGLPTNSDIVVAESTDGGTSWTTSVIAESGDQFMPWAAYDSNGTLRVGYFDRSYDTNNHEYGYTLATETSLGTFSTQQVTTVLSDPTKNDRWFASNPDSESFPYATTFLGDYSNIAATPDGGVVAYWTDMRNDATFGTRTGHGEDAYFAKVSGS